MGLPKANSAASAKCPAKTCRVLQLLVRLGPLGRRGWVPGVRLVPEAPKVRPGGLAPPTAARNTPTAAPVSIWSSPRAVSVLAGAFNPLLNPSRHPLHRCSVDRLHRCLTHIWKRIVEPQEPRVLGANAGVKDAQSGLSTHRTTRTRRKECTEAISALQHSWRTRHSHHCLGLLNYRIFPQGHSPKTTVSEEKGRPNGHWSLFAAHGSRVSPRRVLVFENR